MDIAKADSFPMPNLSKYMESKSLIWKFNFVNAPVLTNRSRVLRFLGCEWLLFICPRGKSALYAGCFLYILGKSQSNMISFELIISDKDRNILFESTQTSMKFVSPGKQLILDGVTTASLLDANPLTVQFRIFAANRTPGDLLTEDEGKVLKVSAKEERQPTLRHSRNFLSSYFEELYNNHRFSDVTLKLAERNFPAHKSVLSARSKVFAAMFEHDMKENRQNSVELLEMEVKTAQDMLHYIYCGKVRNLSPEEALNLYVAADRYDLPELKTFCRETVVIGISTNNVCDIAEVADLHEDELFIRALKSFLFVNGKHVVKTEKWKEIRTHNLALGAKMFEWVVSE